MIAKRAAERLVQQMRRGVIGADRVAARVVHLKPNGVANLKMTAIYRQMMRKQAIAAFLHITHMAGEAHF